MGSLLRPPLGIPGATGRGIEAIVFVSLSETTGTTTHVVVFRRSVKWASEVAGSTSHIRLRYLDCQLVSFHGSDSLDTNVLNLDLNQCIASSLISLFRSSAVRHGHPRTTRQRQSASSNGSAASTSSRVSFWHPRTTVPRQ